MELRRQKFMKKSLILMALTLACASLIPILQTSKVSADKLDLSCASVKEWNSSATLYYKAGVRFCLRIKSGDDVNNTGNHLTWQADGNLVAYDGNGVALWSSKSDNRGKTLELTKLGSIAVLDANNKVVWENYGYKSYTPATNYYYLAVDGVYNDIVEGANTLGKDNGFFWDQPLTNPSV